MSKEMNQGTNTASPTESPMKRKRGRPRKDDSQSSPGLTVPVILPREEGSGASKSAANIQSKGKDSVEGTNDDDDYVNDEMVGQTVTGVLEYAFEAGYFLTVRVGDSNVYMRGVVFKEGCVVPVTPENDIAPNAKMYKRGDFPIPAMKSCSKAPSSLNPTVNNENRQQQKLPSESATQKEDQSLLQKRQSDGKEQHAQVSNDKEQQQEKASDNKKLQEKLSDDKELQKKLSDDKELQEKLSDDKESQDKLLDDQEMQEKLSVGDEIREVGSTKTEGLKDLEEPPMKVQKTDQTTATLLDKEQILQNNAVSDVNSEELKPDEAANDNVVLKEAVILPPETVLPVKDSTVVVPTVVEQGNCGDFGFQISMENVDNEDEASEPPGELASPVKTD